MKREIEFNEIKYPVTPLSFRERKKYLTTVRKFKNKDIKNITEEEEDSLYSYQFEVIIKMTDNKLTKEMIETSPAIDVDKLIVDSTKFIYSNGVDIKK